MGLNLLLIVRGGAAAGHETEAVASFINMTTPRPGLLHALRSTRIENPAGIKKWCNFHELRL
ncbi:MAG TPA: hypothetical protein PKW41_11900 [Clostridia bacterium]|nr:hypothetical protein [Clostridia bacterium]HPK16692.1 hypothetical protein [Clostridia bacterium]